jgi:broad specificity phosphatase PhoE
MLSHWELPSDLWRLSLYFLVFPRKVQLTCTVSRNCHMRLYIIRHADPDYPNNTITPTGHREAKALSKYLAKEKIDQIYCSPLGRAVHTMEYTAKLLKIKPKIEDWTQELSEYRIKHEAGVAWDLHGEIIRGQKKIPTQHDWHKIPFYKDPIFLKKFRSIGKHSDAFLKAHGYRRSGGRYQIVKPNSKKIAVFCHGGFGLTWIAHLLELPLSLVWSGFWLSPSSVTIILFDERSKKWAVPRCLTMASTAHLYKEGHPVTPSGIRANFY